jgi:hypothetical protein
MLTQDTPNVRELPSKKDLEMAKDEAEGYIFHGSERATRKAPAKNSNLLHFAHCQKLTKLTDDQTKFLWFERIRVASAHLNDAVGADRWKWCKQCEAEVTQKLLESEGY